MSKINTSLFTTNGEIAVAQSPADLISAEQYRTVAKLAEQLEVEADQASRSLYDVPVEELSKGGAADLMSVFEKSERKMIRAA